MSERKSIQTILDEIFFGTRLEIIEGSSDRAKAILARLGIILPNEDFALIEGTYMLADEANRNNHRVAEKQIMSALGTLKYKAANYGHDRNHPIGFFIDATYTKETKEMKSCSIVWKAQFPEVYSKIEDLIASNNAGQSFELTYGDSETQTDGTMDLINICFKGGAFLPRDEAACESTNYVIEAKAMSNLIVGGKQEEIIMDKVKEILATITNVKTTDEAFETAMKALHTLEESTLATSCGEVKDGDKVVLDKVEVIELSYEDRKALEDSDFAYVTVVKDEEAKIERNIRRFPIHDAAHVRNSLEAASKSDDLSAEEKVTVEKNILRKANLLGMKALVAIHKDEVAFTLDEVKGIEEALMTRVRKVETTLKETYDNNKSTMTELTKIKEEVNTANKKLETLKYSEEDLKTAVKETLARDKKIADRRAEIEAKEDVKDEDILDDAKYNVLKSEHDIKKLQADKIALEAQIAEKNKVIKAAEEKLGEELPTGGNDLIIEAEKSTDDVLKGMKDKAGRK